MTYLALFSSRSQTLDCIAHLRGMGVPARAVATPKEAGVGCGLSAKFEEGFLPRVKLLLLRRPYSSFAGIMREAGGAFVYL